MDLSDNIWQRAQGGYRTPFNASISLRALEETNDPSAIDQLLELLWTELHHQGDVGLASYLALPQLARIAKQKLFFNWSLLALCATIEQQRQLGDNPALPEDFEEYYYKGLQDLKEFILIQLDDKLDDQTYIVALSALATCSGRVKVGKAIMEFDDMQTLDEFLTKF